MPKLVIGMPAKSNNTHLFWSLRDFNNSTLHGSANISTSRGSTAGSRDPATLLDPANKSRDVDHFVFKHTLRIQIPSKFKKKLSAFSLIEILVVLVIISIAFGMALLAFGDFGEKRRLVTTGEEFIQFLSLAQQQAVLEGNLLNIRIHSNFYEVLRFQNTNWYPLPKNSILHTHYLKNITLRLLYPSSGHGIFISASGDILAFQLLITANSSKSSVKVLHDGAGHFSLEKNQL